MPQNAPTSADEQLSPLEKKYIEPLGDLGKPVPPATPFARVERTRLPKEIKELDLDQVLPPETRMTYDPETHELKATVYGMARDTDDGFLVLPLWTISKDGVQLSVDFHPQDCGGMDIPPHEFIDNLLEDLGKVPNLNRKLIEEQLLKVREAGKAEPDVVVARGELPRNGHDAHLELKFETVRSKGTMREDGSLDFRERGGMTSVEPGDLIAELRLPTKGKAGVDVQGNPIPAQDGEPLDIQTGKGVTREEGEEGTAVFKATESGVAVFKDNTLLVSDLMEIESDIDLASGNILADKGSVRIKGTITTGAKVGAKENVVIEGVVEDALIKAGGDVQITGGVLMEKKGRIEAGGSVQAKFMRNARIKAGGDVIVEVDMVNCVVEAGGKVIAASDKGTLSGGSVICGNGLDVQELGNDAGVSTSVTIPMPRSKEDAGLEERFKAVREDVSELEKYLGADDAVSALLAAPEEDKRILAELFKIRGKLQGEMRELETRRAETLKKLGEDLGRVRIRARKTAHSMTSITIADKTITLKKAEQASQFSWDPEKGGIAITGL